MVERVSGKTGYVVALWNEKLKRYCVVYDPAASEGSVARLLHVYAGGKAKE